MVYRRTKTLADGAVRTYPHWWYRFKRYGVVYRVNTKQGDKGTAIELEADHRTKIARGDAGFHDPLSTPTLKVFKSQFLEAIKARSAAKPRTVEYYTDRFKALLSFPPLANARIDRIDAGLIEKFVMSRPDTMARSTINRNLAVLRRALRLAHEWRLINHVPRIRLVPGERSRTFVLTHEQEKAYLAAAGEPLRDAATLMLDTGLRVGECLALRWSDVVLEPAEGKKFGYVQIRQGKTANAKRSVSLTARAGAVLKNRLANAVNDLVFPGHSIDKPFRPTSLGHQHTDVRDSLKLPKEFVVHSLRHTFLTRLGEAGADAFTIMRIAGHSSIVISARYVHPSDDAMEAAFEKLAAKVHTGGTRNGRTSRKARKQASGG
jgi:integrase